ncbi:hypothetical protein [Peribacillus simplex]|uniref:hypothetical protein n=1 Tax=Peribacillus simplex TaxID=1478 RepID=UPI003D290E9A
MEYIKLNKLTLKTHQAINEAWVQERIAEDPSIIGLGDVELKDKERRQPRAGRLDFLLQDENRRYCVELQLGRTDESHIIRTIEYWDIERKRFPQYEHIGVIIAEDITSRFLNVISLFNSNIPLIAIQLSAVHIEEKIGLHFVKVLDETAFRFEEEEEVESPVTDRAYWENRFETVGLVDQLFTILNENVDLNLTLRYTKSYIGIGQNNIANNFVFFKPRKTYVLLHIKLNQSDEIENEMEEFDIEYSHRGNFYLLKIYPNHIDNYSVPIGKWLKMADVYSNL